MGERWAEVADRWPGRLRVAASLVLPGESVLDIGAGAEGLRGVLDPSCTYTPADQHRRTPDTVVMDLEHPRTIAEHFDVVTLLGVVEYLTDPLSALRHCMGLGRGLVVSYAPGGSRTRRLANGWKNNMTRGGLEALFIRADLVVETKIVWRDQFVYRLAQ